MTDQAEPEFVAPVRPPETGAVLRDKFPVDLSALWLEARTQLRPNGYEIWPLIEGGTFKGFQVFRPGEWTCSITHGTVTEAARAAFQHAQPGQVRLMQERGAALARALPPLRPPNRQR
jgi:hypothetical protein